MKIHLYHSILQILCPLDDFKGKKAIILLSLVYAHEQLRNGFEGRKVSSLCSLLDWNESTSTLFSTIIWIKSFLSHETRNLKIPSLDLFLSQIETISLQNLPSTYSLQLIHNTIRDSAPQQFFFPMFTLLVGGNTSRNYVSLNHFKVAHLKIWRIYCSQELQSQTQQQHVTERLLSREENFWSHWIQRNCETILRERNRGISPPSSPSSLSSSLPSSPLSLHLTANEKDFLELMMTLLMKSLSPEESKRGLCLPQYPLPVGISLPFFFLF